MTNLSGEMSDKLDAAELGIEITKDDARTRIYGMPYGEWKEKFQAPATPEPVAALEARRAKK